jgi:hypothetical protein
MAGKFRHISIAVLLLVAPGCGLMHNGGGTQVTVTSRPSARLYLDDVLCGVTPCVVTVKPTNDGRFKFEQEGYESKTMDIHKDLNPWFFPGNLAWLLIWPAFPIAMGVDLITCNQGKYPTDSVFAELTPVGDEGKAAADPVAKAKPRPKPGSESEVRSAAAIVEDQ